MGGPGPHPDRDGPDEAGRFLGRAIPTVLYHPDALGIRLGLAAGRHRGVWVLRNQFDVVYKFGGGMDYNSFGSILVALGHVGALLLVYKAGRSSG